MTELERRGARILIALSAAGETRVELAVYRYLLGDAPPEIAGLVVEDPALLAHSGSRLAREIDHSGLERRLDAESLGRELRASSAVWRRELETECARLGMKTTFETVRDERRRALARAVERTDALIVEKAALHEALEIWSALSPDAPLRILVLTPRRRPAGDVVVVTDAAEPSDAAGSTFTAALRLARRTGARLAVLDLHAQPSGSGAVARRLVEAGVPMSGYASLAGVRFDAHTLAAHAAHASLLVLPGDTGRDVALVAELAVRIRGALMLVRSPGRPAAGQWL